VSEDAARIRQHDFLTAQSDSTLRCWDRALARQGNLSIERRRNGRRK
jgi:hypothetical protein